MNDQFAIDKATQSMALTKVFRAFCGLALVLLVASPLTASAAAGQKTFATPEAATDALVAALKADDDAAILALFGAKYKNDLISPDHAANSVFRAKIVAAMQTYHLLDDVGTDRRVLLIGEQAWPLPIPLVRDHGAWRFATEEGIEEIVNRRVGADERNAIGVLRA